MKFRTESKPLLNFHSRKYRILLGEIVIFILFITLFNVIETLFPVTTESIRAVSNADYWLYYLLLMIDLGLFGAMFFIIGIWFNDWRRDRNIHPKNL
ncbi:MAG: hypothetical protein ACFFAU_19190 [Candidatus Hodarchaeota archaeon]